MHGGTEGNAVPCRTMSGQFVRVKLVDGKQSSF